MKRQNTSANKQSGFIALITAVILSAVLILIVITLNQNGFIARSEVLDSEYKNRSNALADACIDKALLELSKDPAYAGNETITVIGSDTCEIRPVPPPVSGKLTIESKAIFQKATTNLRIEVNSDDLEVLSWNEMTNF